MVVALLALCLVSDESCAGANDGLVELSMDSLKSDQQTQHINEQ